MINRITITLSEQQAIWLNEAIIRFNASEGTDDKETVLLKLFELGYNQFEQQYPRVPFKLIEGGL